MPTSRETIRFCGRSTNGNLIHMSVRRLIIVLSMLLVLLNMGIYQTGYRTDRTLIVNHEPAATVSIIRGPTVHMVTNHSSRIMWKTDALTNATVEYGYSDSNLNMSLSNATLDNIHKVNLVGLEVNTTYYYRVMSNGTSSATYHFKTAPADGEPFKLIVLGDNRPSSDTAPAQPQVFSDIMDQVIAENPDIVIMTGDYVYSISTSDSENWNAWSKFTNVSDRLGHYVPIYAVIGNHDLTDWQGTPKPQYFLDAFEMFNEPKLYSSFDFAGVHFTLLDSEQQGYEGQIRGEQWSWLVNDLTAAGNRTKFVFAHRPLYPLKHIDSAMDVNKTNRDELQQLFEDQNVTLFAAGHDHLFNRLTVNGVVHVITGGAGAPPYNNPWGGAYYHYFRVDVCTETINMTSVKPDGTGVETYQLPYTGPIEISIRVVANNSQKKAGTIPEIYFSKVPTVVHYSWDSGANSSTLTGIPDIEGEHTLDIYAQDSTGTWSHARFVFTAIVTSTTTTTSTTITTTPTAQTSTGQVLIIPLMLALASIGVVGVVIVVIVWLTKRS